MFTFVQAKRLCLKYFLRMSLPQFQLHGILEY